MSTNLNTNVIDDTTGLPSDHNATNTKPKRTRKGKEKPGKERPRPQTIRHHAAGKAVQMAHWYTGSAVILSSALNCYASVMHSGQSGVMACAAGAIGAVIPLLVWLLGTVTAWTFRSGWTRLSYISGAIACCVLALSVLHVSDALALLTGSHPILAGLLAVGIDCGLVSSETTAVLVSTVEG